MRPTTLHSRQFIKRRTASLLLLCFGLAVGFSQAAFAQSQISWNFVGPIGAPARILAVVADPRNDSVVYVAAPGGGVWKTQDGGVIWAPQMDSDPTLQVCSLALDPRVPDVLYAGTGDDQSPRPAQSVGRSPDGGRSWTFHARFTNQPVCALAIDPANSDRLFAGSAEGLFFSADASVTWNKVLSSPVTSVAFDGLGSVYAGILGDDTPGERANILARSSDGGRTWTNLILPPNPNTIGVQTNWVRVMAASGAVSVLVSYQPTPFIAGSASSAQAPLSMLDFYRTTDAGTTWSSTFSVGRARPPMSLLADSLTGTIYLVGSTLLSSADQGTTWRTIPTTSSEFHTAAFTEGMFLLGGEKGFELVSLVQGTPLARSISQLSAGQFLGVGVDSGGGVWGSGPTGLFGLFPARTTVERLAIPSESGVAGVSAAGQVAVATAGSGNIFISGNSRVFVSTDRGLNFVARTVIAAGELRAPFPALTLDPVNPASAFVAGTRAYRTTNSGVTWTATSVADPDPTHVVVAMTMAPGARTILYAATACLPEIALVACPATSFIWRSPNSGQNWALASTVSGLVTRLAVDPRQANTLYAAIGAFPGGPSISAGFAQGDLLRSTNGGSVWLSVRGNLPHVPVNAIVIDPASLPNQFLPGQFNQPAQTLYVGTDAGVFVSFNAGTLWTDISGSLNRSLPSSPITDLALQPGGTLLAATFGRGIYSAPIAGLRPGVIVNPLSIHVTLMQGTSITTGVPLINASSANMFGWRLNSLDSWISVPEQNGTLRQGTSSQVPIRISAAGLQIGSYRGRLQLISGAFVQTIPVEANVTVSPAQITIASGNNGIGAVGSALPPLQVMISDARQLPLQGVAVTFAIASGGGSLSARTVLTNAAGIAGTILTLPPNSGAVRVVATSGEISVTFAATAVSAPSLLADSVVDGVTFNSYTSLGPGSIIAIFGQNLAEDTVIGGESSLPTELQTTRVLLTTPAGDVALPLFSVSPTLIKALLPADVALGIYRVHVEVGSGRGNDVQISIAAFDPGILTVSDNGRGLGIFLKDDGSRVTASNPADRGSRVTFYAAGLGAVNPPIEAGQPGAIAEPLNRTIRTPRVFFDSYQAEVLYSGLAPGIAGRYQVTVRVPALLSPATNISVSLSIGGFVSNRVTIPVR